MAREPYRARLTKAAMAAPSREVTAAKETTRKMMMALTQRRRSWGARSDIRRWRGITGRILRATQ
jgi:hypothetical protein